METTRDYVLITFRRTDLEGRAVDDLSLVNSAELPEPTLIKLLRSMADDLERHEYLSRETVS